jgi:hypothetical protein
VIKRGSVAAKKVPHMTHPTWDREIAELNRWFGWVQWRTGGRQGSRPMWMPGRQKWAWDVCREYQRLHPSPKPNPMPPVAGEDVSVWQRPAWRGIGVHVAWGLKSGQWTPQQLADVISRSSVQWAALEVNPAVENEQYVVPFRDALHQYGRRFGIWERDDVQKSYEGRFVDHAVALCKKYAPEFYGADIEAFPIQEPTFPTEFAKALPTQQRVAMVAGMPGAELLAPWWDAGWDCMSQSYAANVSQPVEPGIAGNIDHDTYWRGGRRNFVPKPSGWGGLWWQHGSGPHSVPIIEVNGEGNPPLAEQMQSDAVRWFGGNWSIWCAEQLTEADWALLR